MSRLNLWAGGLGRLSLLLAVLALASGCGQPPKWNVLVVTFDTTRADHIGSYGHTGAQTPVVDSLAEEGVLFERAVAPIPITLPSHSSLMTGKVPFTHGVRDNGLFVLGEAQTTLAEILREQGYRTAAAVGSFPLTSQFGIDQGFELFDDHLTQAYENQYGERVLPKDRFFFDERPAARVNDAVLPWLEEVAGEPFFLWLHYFDPHHPHEPPAPYNQLFAHDLYDGEIAYSDESLGVMIDRLKELGVYDNTLIVFTSDHGEGRGEHEESTHSLLIYESTLHVPLIVKAPGGRSRARVAQRVGLVDVLPTILDWLGLPVPEDLQGASLASFLDPSIELPKDLGTGGQTARRELYAETLSPRFSRNWGELRGLFYGDYKYIHGPRPELFDLSRDPKELQDLTTDEPQIASDLKKRLERYLSTHEVQGLDTSVELEEETIRRLEALGYLQASGDRVGPIQEALREDGDPPQDHAHTISAYSHAKSLLFRGDVLQAQDFLIDLLRGDPENTHYLELLCQAKLRLGQPDDALELLQQIEKLAGASQPTDLQRLASRVLRAKGEVDSAYNKLREAETVDPTALGHWELARIHQQKGERSDQQRLLERALELDSRLTPARLDLAIIFAVTGRVDQANEQFRKALEVNPFSARAHYNYGAFLVQTDQRAQAVDHFKRAIEILPNYLQAHYALVEILVGMGQQDQAERHFEILAELAPTSREALLALDLVESIP